MGVMWRDKKLGDMNERDWRIFREDFNIRIKGRRAPLPLRSWAEGNFDDSIMRAIKDMRYKEPSAIQRQVCLLVYVCVGVHCDVAFVHGAE